MPKKKKNGGARFVVKGPKMNQFFSKVNKEDSSQPATTQPENIPTQSCVDEDDNKKEHDDDEGYVKFFVRVGKKKIFQYI